MSINVSLKENLVYGVHVIANDNIDKDEFVFAATPFAYIKYLKCKSDGCFECGRASQNKIHCNNCFGIWFCSKTCASSKAHNADCSKDFDQVDCPVTRLGVEMITTAIGAFKNINAFLQFCDAVLSSNKKTNNNRPPFSLYGEILKLKGQTEKNSVAVARRILNHIGKIPKIEAMDLSVPQQKILFSLAYQHAKCITLNAFSEEIACSKGGAYVRFYIFDVFSRLNHSCQPNLDQYLDDSDVTICIAAQPIQRNEQLFIDYTGGMVFECTKQRKAYLKEGWNFDCKCQKCVLVCQCEHCK